MKASLEDFLIYVSLLALIVASLGFPALKYAFVSIELILFTVKVNKNFKKFVLILVFIFFLTGFIYFSTIIFTLASLIYAVRISKMNATSFYFLVNLCVYVYCFVILYFAFSGYNPNNIINASRNHLAVPLIALGSLKLFLVSKFGFKPSMLSSSLITIVAVWSISRGSISAALLLVISAYQLKSNGGFLKNIILPIFLALFIYTNYSSLKKHMYSKSFSLVKFYDNRNSISDDPRAEIINEYIKSTNVKSFLLGRRIETTAHNNYHNSYISAHSMFGISFLIFFVYFVVKLKFSVIYLAPLLVRSLSDTILFFNGEFDFILFVVILLCSKKPNAKADLLYSPSN